MNTQLIRADITRYLVGRSWRALMLGGLAFGLLVSYGYISQLDSSAVDAVSETALSASMWMTMYLFVALLSGSLFALDAASGTLARLLWASQGRPRLFVVRTVTATLAGVIFGLVAVVSAVASTAVLMPRSGIDPVFGREFALTVLGVFICCVSASVVGLFTGMVLRGNAATMATIALITMLVEPALQRLRPEQAKYLYTIALSAVYRDDNDHLLSMTGGLVVSTIWLTLLGGLAYHSLLTKDVGS